MDGQKDDTHKASDGQAEGIAYDPFVLFGPGSAGKRRRLEREEEPQRTCKHRGRWLNLCKCNTSVDGGIGRIFMNRRQIDISYSLLAMREAIPDKPFLVRSLFERTVRQGRYYWCGRQVEYREHKSIRDA